MLPYFAERLICELVVDGWLRVCDACRSLLCLALQTVKQTSDYNHRGLIETAIVGGVSA